METRVTPARLTVVAASLAVLLAAPVAPVEAAPVSGPGSVQKPVKVKGRELKATPKPADTRVDEAAKGRRVRAELPAPGSASVPARAARHHALVAGDGTPAGKLPVRAGWVKGTGASPPIRVTTLPEEQAAELGVEGVVLRVDAEAPSGASALQLDVDYSAFADAFGGDWASRLRLVSLPACALDDPGVPGCRKAAELDTLNAAGESRVSGSVPLSAFEDDAQDGMRSGEERAGRAAARSASVSAAASTTATAVVALAATESGGAGDWSATSLSSSAVWSAGGNGGSFTWTYPLRTPPGVNGPTPSLEFGYDSGAIDGRVASTNNQSSWVGEGWSLGDAYVERSYVGCADDMGSGSNNTKKTGDLCWKTDNATLVLPGHTSELVKDSSSGNWFLKNQDGSRIVQKTGASNGDDNGEHWVLTTPDGTQYHFGLHKRYSADTAATNSTWTVPVAGNHSGEKCYVSGNFAGSFCKQAWRWNLDYVVDASGNSMTYFYTQEKNRYRRSDSAKSVEYVRGGYLSRIEYGQRKGSEASASAPARVVFTTAERCIPTSSFTCAAADLTSTNASKWPDVPFDLICTNTTECKTTQTSPAFFSRKRLTRIDTSIYLDGAYTSVDRWSLVQSFPATGDGTSPALWLASITHTGQAASPAVGAPLSTPAVTFKGIQLRNRVQNQDSDPPLVRWRVSQIDTEAGGRIDVSYLDPQCTASSLPAPESNTKRCFPTYWLREGATEQTLTWFNKYPVSQVVESDLTGLSPAKVTTYQYEGNPAWHYDDNELGKRSRRTYSDWRGYPKVKTLVGDPSGPKLVTRTTYLQGMHGDQLPGGGSRSVTVTDSKGGTVTDSDAAKGFELEAITYLGDTSTEVSGEINRPWISAAVATGGGDTARFVEVASTTSRTRLSSGGEQVTKVTNTYDASTGMVTQVDDAGDVAVSGDETCTRTKYTSNSTLNILDTVYQEEVVSVACAATPSRPADVVSDVRTYYDGATSLTAAPTKGLETRTEQRSGARTDSSTPYVTTSRTGYDVHGRVVSEEDGDGRKVTTAYTPTTGGPVTKVVTTNALGHAKTTVLLPHWGVPDTVTEANGTVTSGTYDALGRIIGVWKPGRVRGTDTASVKYTYSLRKDAPSAVTTQALLPNSSYRPSIVLYDGLLRSRQTQEPAFGSDGGRLVTDTLYDGRGLAIENLGPYWASGTASTTAFVPTTQVSARTLVEYDGVGREVKSSFYTGATLRWGTQTVYGGNWTAVTPPAGGTPTRAITDAHGRTIELREYTAGSPADDANTAYVKTRYTYTADDQQAMVAGPMPASASSSPSTWKYTYDLMGRTIQTDDPDAGTSYKTYTTAGLAQTSTDARGAKLWHVYDSIGRQVEIRKDSATGTLLTKRVYDTVKAGMLTSSTRYVANGSSTDAFTTSVDAYDTAGRPTSSTVTIPDSFGALKGAYNTAFTYNAVGDISRVTYPAVGDLPREAVVTSYDSNGQPLLLAGVGSGTYVNGTLRSSYGQALRYAMNLTASGSGFAWQTFAYEDGTQRLQGWKAQRENATGTDADVSYTYDAAGNVTSTADRPTGADRGSDVQCFTYDGLGRMTQAWTPASSCASAPAQSLLAGSAPYWQKFSYDERGNRTSEQAWTTTASVARAYTYGSPAGQPDALTKVTTSGSTSRTDIYGYDASGNTTARTVGSAAQTLTWDEFGKVATTTATSKVTRYFYDADGNRLARTNPAAAGSSVSAAGATVFVGGAEITLTPNGTTATATRYYSFDGRTVAARTAAGVKLILGDHQGTAQLQITMATGAVQRRYSLPFGGDRSTVLSGSGAASSIQPSGWSGQQGFVGGTQDIGTGLINIGARQYDPATGRFISVDPVFDGSNPQSWNGYAYAGNAPATHSDPTGLCYGMSIEQMKQCGQGWSNANKIIKKGTKAGGNLKRSIGHQRRFVPRRQLRPSAFDPVKSDSLVWQELKSPARISDSASGVEGAMGRVQQQYDAQARANRNYAKKLQKSGDPATRRFGQQDAQFWQKQIGAKSDDPLALVAKSDYMRGFGRVMVVKGFADDYNWAKAHSEELGERGTQVTVKSVAYAGVNTGVGIGAGMAAGAAAGAAVGSVVPVAGTAAGAIVGLGVGAAAAITSKYITRKVLW